MIQKYTITQAAKEALKSIPNGADFHGYEYFNLCRKNLLQNGSRARPYDGTLIRYLRYFGSLYGIKLKDRHKSIYHKEISV